MTLVGLFGATRTAVSSGNWTTNSTWNCTCQPSNNDNVIIPSGITVTIGFPGIDLTGASIITITVNGTLRVSNASLLIDNNDVIAIATGGQLTSSGLGGLVFSGSGPIFVDPSSPITGPSTITGGVLPVELLYFQVQVKSELIEITWATASEKNADYFEIQKSMDGIEFSTLVSINAAGNSMEEIEYGFTDRHPVLGTSYYRLTQTDIDGSVQVFEIEQVVFDGAQREITIYPNPVLDGLVRMDLNFQPSPSDKLLILNSVGRVVFERPIHSLENKFELPSAIGPGIYVIHARFKDRVVKQRVVVR
jgi:hypothetical protein